MDKIFSGGLPNPPAFGGGPPSQPPTYLTSGSGTFIPKAATQWLRVTMIGGGAGGNSTSGSNNCTGGAAAKPVTHWIKKTKASYAYAIGAGGTGVASASGTAGGDTTFDTLTAYGAQGGGPNPTQQGVTFHGESNGYGKGGAWAYGNATGYGAGGGGANGSGTSGGNGSGGLIIIEEY